MATEEVTAIMMRLGAARQATAVAHAYWTGARDAGWVARARGAGQGEPLPAWAGGAMTETENAAMAAYGRAQADEVAALAELTAYVDRKVAAAAAEALFPAVAS